METAHTSLHNKLQQEILKLQGYRAPVVLQDRALGLGMMETAFPFSTFPLHTIHAFSSTSPESAASTNGFMAALLGKILLPFHRCLWVSCGQLPYPPALKNFLGHPDQIIFVHTPQPKDLFWIIEEALKCETLTAVVGITDHLNFTASRRLLLAVEQSHVTGFIHHTHAVNHPTIACAAHWHISPLPSVAEEGLPGIGFLQWKVRLVKVKHGRPGNWPVQWKAGHFHYQDTKQASIPAYFKLQTG